MKNFKITSFGFALSFLLFGGLLSGGHELHAQTKKKNRARINADFVNVIDGEKYLNIKASARVNKKTVELADLDLTVYQLVDDKEEQLGSAKTNSQGLSKFIFENFSELKADSLGLYTIVVSFDGNDDFRKASREVSFKDAHLKAEWVQKDSLNYVRATLVESISDSAVADMPINVRIDRLFRPLDIGESNYRTNEKGRIEVQIEDGIPGINGEITIETVLSESDEYGTVISKVKAPIGTVIVEESTFDQRTMWSPRGKTPYFLLWVTYSFLAIVWGLFAYLFYNLIRINKS